MLNIVSVILSLAVTFLGPVVAFPLAGFLKQLRQRIDDGIVWNGNGADKKEKIEDAVTYSSLVLVSVLSFLVIGGIYVWYVQGIAYAINPWLYRPVPTLPVFGNSSIGYYDTAPMIYWAVFYWIAFLFGLIRQPRRK